MANEKNLIPQAHVLTVEEQSKAGKASGEARRKKRDIRAAMEALLEQRYQTNMGELSGAEAISLKQMEKALKGDPKAFELVRDSAGQKPVDKIEQVNIDMEYENSLRYIDDLMRNDDEKLKPD